MDLRSLDPAKHARSLFDEFKAFAFKGNVIDLAVGVIIGGWRMPPGGVPPARPGSR